MIFVVQILKKITQHYFFIKKGIFEKFMTNERFTISTEEEIYTKKDECFIRYHHYLYDGAEKIIELKAPLYECEDFAETLNEIHAKNKVLYKQLHLNHMASMFSTVKSFKGEVSKRYVYDEETDTIFDTANHYGQYSKILDKKEVTLLLNEYNALLENPK